MLYMVTFTINIPQLLAYIPYMDPMGKVATTILITLWHAACQEDLHNLRKVWKTTQSSGRPAREIKHNPLGKWKVVWPFCAFCFGWDVHLFTLWHATQAAFSLCSSAGKDRKTLEMLWATSVQDCLMVCTVARPCAQMQHTIEISNMHPYEHSHSADSQPKNAMPTPAIHPQARDRAYTTKSTA